MRKFFILLLLVTLFGCVDTWEDTDKHIYIDFKDDSITDNETVTPIDSSDYLKVAVSSMVSPSETFYTYNQVLSYLEDKLKRRITLVQRKTYQEINDLLERDSIDMAFICSGAYVAGIADSAFDLLAIPEMAGNRYYHAYLIVNKNSNYQSFEDLRGKKFVFSDSLSNTGMYYPLKRLHDNNSTPGNFFSNTYFSNAHDYSIELVARGVVDGASVNALIFDYIKRMTPEKVMNVKIIERSEPFGMPPVVVSKGIDPALKSKLNDLLVNMNKDAKGREILGSLMIDRFVNESDTLYNGIRLMCKGICN